MQILARLARFSRGDEPPTDSDLTLTVDNRPHLYATSARSAWPCVRLSSACPGPPMTGEQASYYHGIRFHPAIRANLNLSGCILVLPSTPRSARQLLVESIAVIGSLRPLLVHTDQQHCKRRGDCLLDPSQHGFDGFPCNYAYVGSCSIAKRGSRLQLGKLP